MQLFHPRNRNKSPERQRIYANIELLYTLVDFSAAILFVIGSILFFKSSTLYVGTWLFLIGSVFFAVRPTLKLTREIIYMRMGESDGDSDKS